jgi:SAM-dependent methyltransferase
MLGATRVIRRAMLPLQPLVRKIFGIPRVLLEEMPDCPALFHTYRVFLETGHIRVPGGWIYESEFYPDYLTVGGNTFAIKRTALKYCKGVGIDIGAGHWPFPGSIPIDTEVGPGAKNKFEEIPNSSQDYVFSSHCLEHIEKWQNALDLWIAKLKPGGVLFLYLPHPSCKLWHMSNPFIAGIHKWAPDPQIIGEAILSRGLTLVDRDDGPDHFYSFFVCARKPDISLT